MTQVLVFRKEALSLNTGHIKHIQPGHHIFHVLHLSVLHTGGVQHIRFDIIRHCQLLGGNQHKLHIRIAAHSLNEGMHRAAKFQIPAKADGQVVQTTFFPINGKQVR